MAAIVNNGWPLVNACIVRAMRAKVRSAFGARLYKARTDRKMTQMKVAKAIGISQGTLTQLETTSNGSTHTAQLAKLYGVDANWLATGEGGKASEEAADLAAQLDKIADPAAKQEAYAMCLRIIELEARTVATARSKRALSLVPIVELLPEK